MNFRHAMIGAAVIGFAALLAGCERQALTAQLTAAPQAPTTEPSGIVWMNKSGAADWGVVTPRAEGATNNSVMPGQPAIVRIFIKNQGSHALAAPASLYRSPGSGGPALVNGFTMTLRRAPFDPRPSAPSWRPRDESFADVTRKAASRFAVPASRITLNPGQIAEVRSIDLRDLFVIDQLGYYEFEFDFNAAALGLPKPPDESGQVSFMFAVGPEPRRQTAEEANQSIPPFGGKDVEAKLRGLIAQMSPPATRPTQVSEIPADFPALNPPRMSGNGPAGESRVVWFANSNREFAKRLEAYEPQSVCRELEKRLTKEMDGPTRLYLAILASRFGSRAGALELLEWMKKTDYWTAVHHVVAALRCALWQYESDPPEWLVEMVMAEISDERYTTGARMEGPGGSELPVSWEAEQELVLPLGQQKCRQALPLLIKMAIRPEESSQAIMALGDMGDPSAIAPLLQILTRREKEVPAFEGLALPESFEQAARSLGQLKAKEAVPILLRHLQYQYVIEALEAIGDKAAIAPLEQLVATRKVQKSEGGNVDADPSTIASARIALVTLKDRDPIPAYVRLLADQSLHEYDRRSVVWRLGDRRDPRAIPYLLSAIRNDPSGAVVNQSITVLAVFKYKSSARGLIDCMDADFAGKSDWKRAYAPEMFAQNIGDSLHEITGQSFGSDQAQWRKWWTETGSRDPNLPDGP